eukprot:6584786-Prymnesium_polylepis.1
MPLAPSIRLPCNSRRLYQRQRPRGPRSAMPLTLAENGVRSACPPTGPLALPGVPRRKRLHRSRSNWCRRVWRVGSDNTAWGR